MLTRAARLQSLFRGGVLPSFLVLTAFLGAAGCAGAPEPVARLEVEADDLVLPHGGWAELELRWFPLRSLEAADAELVVFVHLLDANGTLVRTFDHAYPHPWEPGVERSHMVHLSQSALAQPLAPGAYSLTLGLWDRASGSRWPLEIEAGTVGRAEYSVASVEVPDAAPGVTLSVEGEVLEPEAGADLQILTRLDLVESAQIRVEGVDGPGVMLLGLTVDEVAPLLAGSGPGSVAISGGCGCPSSVVTETGLSVMSLPLSPEEGADSCFVLLEPDDPMLIAMAVGRRRVAITGLAWRPAAP